MYKIMRVLFVIPAGILLGLIISTGGVQAQQSPAAATTQGCDPCISKPSSYSRIEDDPAYKIRMKYCAEHPEKCRPPDMRSPENAAIMEKANETQAAKYPYQKPQPGGTNWCYQRNPSKYVCIPDTWTWPNQPQYGHCYTNPNNPSEQRCVPTREQLMKAK